MSRYDDLRAVYREMIDSHEDAKQRPKDEYDVPVGRGAPPIPKTEEAVEAFWRGYQRGYIECILAVEDLLNEWDDAQ